MGHIWVIKLIICMRIDYIASEYHLLARIIATTLTSHIVNDLYLVWSARIASQRWDSSHTCMHKVYSQYMSFRSHIPLE